MPCGTFLTNGRLWDFPKNLGISTQISALSSLSVEENIVSMILVRYSYIHVGVSKVGLLSVYATIGVHVFWTPGLGWNVTPTQPNLFSVAVPRQCVMTHDMSITLLYFVGLPLPMSQWSEGEGARARGDMIETYKLLGSV